MTQTPFSPRPTLAAIITAARAGSLSHAQAMFNAAGFDARSDDAAALAVKGRLLKDLALRASAAARQQLFLHAAQSYAAAYRISPQPYTRINEASLLLLAGYADTAKHIAADLLARLKSDSAFAETPYYIAATQAEAALICGETAEAEAALATAITHDPDGWTDHASTLRQFALILDAVGADAGWLDAYRPPASLNFAGHLGVSARASSDLRATVDDFLATSRIGFGYGALAAGADIVIAEALLARGAALHVVLPTNVDVFIAQSLTPYEAEWRARFELCMADATSLHCVTSVTGGYEPLATKLAADVAMGAAMLNARQLASKAAQLLVIDDAPGRFGAGLGTTYLGERWHNGGLQKTVVLPRTAPVIASGKRTDREGRIDRRIAALLMVSFDGLEQLDEGAFAEAVDGVIAPFRAAAAALPIQPDITLPAGNARIMAFADPDCAWDYARRLLALPAPTHPLRVAGHYALAHWLCDPNALVGPSVTALSAVAAAALPGVLTVTETLAAALFVNGADTIWAEHIGETHALRLYALTPRDPTS